MRQHLVAIFQSTEFWSTIVGAVVGGAIALCIQIVALRDARRVRAEDRENSRAAIANSVTFKLVKIHANTKSIDKHFENARKQADIEKFEGEPWQIYTPIANPPEPTGFSSDEMSLVLSLKDDEIFRELMNIELGNSALIASVKAFNHSRVELETALAVSAQIIGEQGSQLSHIISSDNISNVRPKNAGRKLYCSVADVIRTK